MASTGARRPVRIELSGVTKRFSTPSGSMRTALRSIDLAVGAGEFVAVVGPTGCGKSTTLDLITGLARPARGDGAVWASPVDGIDRGHRLRLPGRRAVPVEDRPRQRDGGAALPRRAEGRGRGPGPRLDAPRRPRRLRGALSAPAVRRHAQARGARRRPSSTSRQILLMDEPFSALDVQTRATDAGRAAAAVGADPASVVFVTHDLEEAIALADKVVVMTAGPAHGQGGLRHRPAAAARRGRRSASNPASSSSTARSGHRCATRSSAAYARTARGGRS